MSVRPTIMTIFGIDDYKGPRPDKSFWESQVQLTDKQIKDDFDLTYVKDYAFDYRSKEWRWYSDVLYFSSFAEKLKGIAGLIKSRDFDSDTFRVLGMLYPEFFESGYRDVPAENLGAMQEFRLRHGQPFSRGGIEFQQHWFYSQGYYQMTPTWAFVTKWLLDSVGIETDPKRYKWMLVWEWA